MTFAPRLDILPPGQRRLWPELAPLAPAGFVLYGGTAIALRRGHRVSVAFDCFQSRPLDRAGLDRPLPWLSDATVVQDQPLAQGVGGRQGDARVRLPQQHALKAPVFFDDGDLSDLPSAVCRQLEQAVRAVEEIPSLARLSPDLSPCERLG